MERLFHDEFPAKTRLAYERKPDRYGRLVPTGQPLGVEVVLTCSECGCEAVVRYPWNEVVTLLQGGQVQGVTPANAGWQGRIYCPRNNCTSMQGRTVLTYNLYYNDLDQHVKNLQAGRRQGPPQPPPNMGGGWPY